MKKILFSILTVILLSGCMRTIVKKEFIVSRNVPEDPAICVLPFNDYHYQITFADNIEATLISLGVRVIKYQPNPREVIEGKGLSIEEKDNKLEAISKTLSALTAKGSKEAVTIHSYVDYGEINADYIFYPDVISRRVKLVKKDNFEVLASFIIEKQIGATKEIKEYKFKKIIHDSLEALGIPVRDLPPPPPPPQQKKTKSSTDEPLNL